MGINYEVKDDDKPAKVWVEAIGLGLVKHNFPCPVYRDQKAIHVSPGFYFQPSWEAQKDGWKLIQAKSCIQKIVIRIFFN